MLLQPGAQLAHSQALIDQVEGVGRKFEYASGIHDLKLYPVTDRGSFGLFSHVQEKYVARIYSYQFLHGRKSFGDFNEPAAYATPYIQYLLESGMGELWEGISHARGEDMILKTNTLQLVPIGTILHKVRAWLF